MAPIITRYALMEHGTEIRSRHRSLHAAIAAYRRAERAIHRQSPTAITASIIEIRDLVDHRTYDPTQEEWE